MLSYYDAGKRKHKRLCGPKATLAEIWQATEAQKERVITTFTSLSLKFQVSPDWRGLGHLTQRDYLQCHQSISTRKTSTALLLGDVPIKNWTPGTVRKYRDARAEESKSAAKKDMAYMTRVFNWAREYELITTNPATGIKKPTVPPRQHYATDRDYYFLLEIAKNSNYEYMEYAMELAYLCRMRLSEVLDLTDANETAEGLVIIRRKGSKTNIVEWEPRLLENWQAVKNRRNKILETRRQPHPIRADMRYLFISDRTGNKLVESSLKTAMSRLKAEAREKAKKLNLEFTDFCFHDLKKKGVTDTKGDKMKISGHRTRAMADLYDLSIDIVKPTK